MTTVRVVGIGCHAGQLTLEAREATDGWFGAIDDERILEHLSDEDKARIVKKKVRFRTLGCYPLTGAVESEAESLTDIIQEMLLTRTSERQGRVIDHDGAGSMEDKKRQGYF